MFRRSKETFLVPVMTLPQRLIFLVLRIVWFAALVFFWQWWARAEHVTTIIGFCVTCIVVFWETVMPAYFFFFAGRMKQANIEIDPPKGRVLIAICGTPGEPWDTVIRPTVEAALQTAHLYTQITGNQADIAVLHENPGTNSQISSFCKRNGVAIYSRYGKPQYHQKEFPFRTKSKEGNLNSAIHENKLLDKYQFMFTFDCDHRPDQEYLLNAMRYFADPQVGIVSAPSICDANLQESWVVKGRADIEGGLHGIQQAGSHHPFASMAIGSHYGFRTAAVKQNVHPKRASFFSQKTELIIAPIGPELAEDHVTTLATNASGWKSVHAIDATAHGDGATSFADSMTQEYQWSRSLTVVLLKWTSGYFKFAKMGIIKKGQFLFSQLWYPLFAFTLLTGFIMPPLALVLKLPWVNVNYGEYLIHWVPLTIAVILPIIWIMKQGFMRPVETQISWQSFLFTLVRWPWSLYGVIHGIVGVVILNRELPFKVTPKGAKGAQPLPLTVLLPYILIVLISVGSAFLVDNPGAAGGYYWFALLNGFIYLIAMLAIIILHLRENQVQTTSPLIFVWKPLFVLILLVTLFCTTTAMRGLWGLASITDNPTFIGMSSVKIAVGYSPNGKRIYAEQWVTPTPQPTTQTTETEGLK